MVQVGGYVLEPGAAGTTIRSDSGAPSGEVESLQHAFAEAAPPKQPESALATEVDEASQATAKIERAVALCKGVGEGKALDPTQLGLEVGALLDCLERLDRKKEHRKSIQMARALASLLMLLKRWADLLQTLRTVLRAGEALGDQETIAWARHELGTLKLAAGDVAGADRDLGRAREIREQIGDRRGLAATERNLHALCDHLRSTLHEQEATRSRNGRRRPLRLLSLAAVFAAFGGGLAIGMAAGDDSGQGTVAETTVTQDGPEEVTDEGVTEEENTDEGDVTDEALTDEVVTDEGVVTDREERKVEPRGGEVPDKKLPAPEERLPPVTETNPPTPEFETSIPLK